MNMKGIRNSYKLEIIKIKGLREKLGLTQERLAARLGVTVSTVNRWENNKGHPSPLARIRIEEFLQKGREESKGGRNGI